MKVKIKKCSVDTYWYNDCVGEVFKVKQSDFWTNSYVRLDDPTYFINKQDCEIVKSKSEQLEEANRHLKTIRGQKAGLKAEIESNKHLIARYEKDYKIMSDSYKRKLEENNNLKHLLALKNKPDCPIVEHIEKGTYKVNFNSEHVDKELNFDGVSIGNSCFDLKSFNLKTASKDFHFYVYDKDHIQLNMSDSPKPTKEEVFQIIEKLLTIETLD